MILYDHIMIMYVGHSAVVFHVFMFFHVLCFTDGLCGCVFFSDILLIYSAVYLPVCLINLLTYLLTSAKVKLKNPMPRFFSETQCRKKTLKQPVAKDGVVLGESNGACSSRVLE